MHFYLYKIVTQILFILLFVIEFNILKVVKKLNESAENGVQILKRLF